MGWSVEQRTRVIEYTDGSEQRISRRGRAFRQWSIRLDRLSEREAADLLTFFAQRHGRAEEFEFEDPITGAVVPNCRFEQDEVSFDFSGESGARGVLTFRSGG
jgi:hypothetical protein